MDYKKKYEEALERARELYNKEYYNFGRDDMVYLFPELAESEDEKIRRQLMRVIVEQKLFSVKREQEVLTWLEKQKEQAAASIDSWKSANHSDVQSNKMYVKGKEYDLTSLYMLRGGDLLPERVSDLMRHQRGWDMFVRNCIEKWLPYIFDNKENAKLVSDKARKYLSTFNYWKGDGLEEQKEQKPMNNPKWNELTWKDINELEEIINQVHYEFRNGISAEGFGKEVLEQFRNMKEDAEVDACEQKPAEWSEEDEKIANEILDHFNTENAEWFNWFNARFKSLRPQPKQEQDSSEPIPDSVKFDEGFKTGREVGFREGVESVKPAEIDEYKIIKKHITRGSLSGDVNKRLTECGWYVTDEKPAEWSEEDEGYRKSSIKHLEIYANMALSSLVPFIKKDIDWLKSFRPQPKWRRYTWNLNMRFEKTALIKYEERYGYEIVTPGCRPSIEKSGSYIFIDELTK